MNSLLLAIILIPTIEIYLFIKIGSYIGAIYTILLIFFTAFIGIYYARAEGLNTLNKGLVKLVKNQIPAYEMISGALIAVGAIFLIIPGFATDLVGFLIIFPPTRKMVFKKFSAEKNKNNTNTKDYIEGEYKDLDDRLSKSKFLAGNYSIADIATFPWIARHDWHDIGLKNYKNLRRWYDEISSRDSVIKGFDILKRDEKIPPP